MKAKLIAASLFAVLTLPASANLVVVAPPDVSASLPSTTVESGSKTKAGVRARVKRGSHKRKI